MTAAPGNIPLYQVDAFADRAFSGNPAAVCPLDNWLPDDLMRGIAAENNLSETAFFVPRGDCFDLRWFTPAVEIDLCGRQASPRGGELRCELTGDRVRIGGRAVLVVSGTIHLP